LKSESEERETWTAESLRAASARGSDSLFGAALEETSAVFTFQGTSLIAQAIRVDLVKRKRPAEIKVLIQLESLILAQSERWRQA
jgi:hypothetical protein